jgi:hypothetical protein
MLEKIAYSICHVPSNSDIRMQNYENLLNAMPKELHIFPPSVVHLKNSADYKIATQKFNKINIKNYLYPEVSNPYNQTVRGGDGPYKNIQFPNSNGEIGLYFSAYSTFKRFLTSKFEYLIWIEDDSVVMPNFKNNLTECLNNVNFQFDLISLGMQQYQLNYYQPYYEDFGNEYFSKVYQVFWAGGILFSRNGIQKIINDLETNGIAYPFDWYLYNIRAKNLQPISFDAFNIKPNKPMLVKPDEISSINSTIDATDKIGAK